MMLYLYCRSTKERNMLALRLPKHTEERLQRLARRTGRTKSYYAKLAIQEFLDDQEDYLIALDRLQRNLQGIPLEEAEPILNSEF
jgi:RHH-type rel operon transcriptional repressor/antitoxin RelB